MLRLFVFSMVFLLSSSLTVFGQAYYAQFSGKVVSVYDGDTFTLQLSLKDREILKSYLTIKEYQSGLVRIRLAGVNAPEIPRVPYSVHAKNYLGNGIYNKIVRVVVKATSSALNRSFDRLVGHVFVGSSDVSLAMLYGGYAVDDPRYSLGSRAIQAQWSAMNQRRGIWSDPVQYQRENEYRKRLYGTQEANIVIVPMPSSGVSASVAQPKKFFPNPGVGKNDWQRGFQGRPQNIPRFKN